MILVILGTNPYSFSRLAKAADEYAVSTGKEVFIQLGNTRDYRPVNAQYDYFLSKQDLLEKINDAEIVVTQGGFGSIADCLLAGKKVIAVPRMPEFHEAPDRQEELVRELEKLGRLVGVYETKDLQKAIEAVGSMALKGECKTMIPRLIMQFLSEHSR